VFVRIRGASLYFDVEGTQLAVDPDAMREKPTLICLHGGPGLDHSTFRPDFAPLGQISQVIYLDQRGHGRSDRTSPDSWNLANWADDLACFCDTLGITNPVVLGTSFGGYVAMEYAIRHPEQPAGLILISTSARGTGSQTRRGNVLEAFARRGGEDARRAVIRAFDERTPDAYENYGKVCGPLYNHRLLDAGALNRTIRNPEILPYFERPGGEGVEFDLTDGLAKIRARTLVIGGSDDPITPLPEQEHIVASMAPGLATLLRFDNCGHGVQRDNPEGLIEVIRDFLTGQDC